MKAATSSGSIGWSGWTTSTPSSGATSLQSRTATALTRAAPSSVRAILKSSEPPSHPVSPTSNAAARASRGTSEQNGEPRRSERRRPPERRAASAGEPRRRRRASWPENIHRRRAERAPDRRAGRTPRAVPPEPNRANLAPSTAITLTHTCALLDSIVNGPQPPASFERRQVERPPSRVRQRSRAQGGATTTQQPLPKQGTQRQAGGLPMLPPFIIEQIRQREEQERERRESDQNQPRTGDPGRPLPVAPPRRASRTRTTPTAA